MRDQHGDAQVEAADRVHLLRRDERDRAERAAEDDLRAEHVPQHDLEADQQEEVPVAYAKTL